jgi:hypothetical protein
MMAETVLCSSGNGSPPGIKVMRPDGLTFGEAAKITIQTTCDFDKSLKDYLAHVLMQHMESKQLDTIVWYQASDGEWRVKSGSNITRMEFWTHFKHMCSVHEVSLAAVLELQPVMNAMCRSLKDYDVWVDVLKRLSVPFFVHRHHALYYGNEVLLRVFDDKTPLVTPAPGRRYQLSAHATRNLTREFGEMVTDTLPANHEDYDTDEEPKEKKPSLFTQLSDVSDGPSVHKGPLMVSVGHPSNTRRVTIPQTYDGTGKRSRCTIDDETSHVSDSE